MILSENHIYLLLQLISFTIVWVTYIVLYIIIFIAVEVVEYYDLRKFYIIMRSLTLPVTILSLNCSVGYITIQVICMLVP